jgi:hypothetical protein
VCPAGTSGDGRRTPTAARSRDLSDPIPYPIWLSLTPILVLFRCTPGVGWLLTDSDTGWHIRAGGMDIEDRTCPHYRSLLIYQGRPALVCLGELPPSKRQKATPRNFIIGRCTGVAGGSQVLATAPQKGRLSRDFKAQPCCLGKTFASGGSELILLCRNRKSGPSA